MNYQFTIQFTEGHIKYACHKFFARYVGIGLPIVGVLMLAALVQRLHSGQMDLLSGFFMAVVIMSVGIFVSAYFQRRNYAISQFKKMGNGLVSYELSDEFFKAKSNLGSTELKWEAFKAIWIFPAVWLLMFDKAAYLTLPVEQISSDVKDFFKQKIISIGGKIK
jgi:hypothetical protein